MLDRPVSDQTTLTGTFDFELAWRPNENQFGGRFAAAGETAGELPDLFTALNELGLTLEVRKAPTQFLVIDHADRPTEN